MKYLKYTFLLIFTFIITCSSNIPQKQIQTNSSLKAILIVGDFLSENMENDHIKEILVLSSFLQDLGIETHVFLPPCKYNNHESYAWEDILKVKEPIIFIYAGHGGNNGSIWIEDAPMDIHGPSVQGVVERRIIIKDLKLHKNALVMMLYACFSAGSSSSDNKNIGVKEAHKRVREFAYPYIKVGAAIYFATNWTNGYSFLKMFIDNNTIKQSSKALILQQKVVVLQKYKYNQKYEICVTKNNYGNNFTSYNFAYVAKTNFTFNYFFNH